jgi:hypothetical protein
MSVEEDRLDNDFLYSDLIDVKEYKLLKRIALDKYSGWRRRKNVEYQLRRVKNAI